MKILQFLNDQQFIQALKLQGEVYLVGGAVRDNLLNKESKDIDLLVTGIELSKLHDILSKFGQVMPVGKSFGINKFRPFNWVGEPIDIAIPRTERKISDGHKGFEIISDHNLPLTVDLNRRDFTVNAIAINLAGTIFDPFNGIEDIKNKMVTMVNRNAFIDDPLRIVRAIQFAARFGFHIEHATFYSMFDNIKLITELSGERIFMEFEKIFDKHGDFNYAIELIDQFKIKEILGAKVIQPKFVPKIDNIKIKEDFFTCIVNDIEQPGEFLRKKLPQANNKLIIFVETFKELISKNLIDHHQIRIEVFNALKKCKELINTGILPDNIMTIIDEMKSGRVPKSMSDIKIDGNDIISEFEILPGEKIGKILKIVTELILTDKLHNDKFEILKYLKTSL